MEGKNETAHIYFYLLVNCRYFDRVGIGIPRQLGSFRDEQVRNRFKKWLKADTTFVRGMFLRETPKAAGGDEMNEEEHRKLLRDVDERVLPRRELETDEEYGKRMYDFLNRYDIYSEKYAK